MKIDTCASRTISMGASAFLCAALMLMFCSNQFASGQQAGVEDGNSTVRERVTTTVRETETTVRREREAEPMLRTVAIFVKNRADKVPDDKVMVLEDLVVSRLTDKGFRIVSREDAANAVAAFANEGANAGNPALKGADIDALLSNNTSALHLARNLAADYILSASITTFSNTRKDGAVAGQNMTIGDAKMRVSYKLLDTSAAGSLTGDVVQANKKQRVQSGQSLEDDGTIDDLLDESAVALVDILGNKAATGRIRTAPPGKDDVEFTVVCGMADLTVPEVAKTEAGEYVVGNSRYQVQAINVTVALDGVVVGTTPGPFRAAPGMHKIRLSRENFDDIENTISIRPGMELRMDMKLSKDGYARWRQTASFMEGLKAGSKLTDAQVKAWEGFAKFLEQSGYRVDIRGEPKIMESAPAVPGSVLIVPNR